MCVCLFFFLVCKQSWNLLKDHCFAFAVYTRNGCQRLQGIQLPVAPEGRLCKVRQIKQLARVLSVENRNEEAKCKISLTPKQNHHYEVGCKVLFCFGFFIIIFFLLFPGLSHALRHGVVLTSFAGWLGSAGVL